MNAEAELKNIKQSMGMPNMKMLVKRMDDGAVGMTVDSVSARADGTVGTKCK